MPLSIRRKSAVWAALALCAVAPVRAERPGLKLGPAALHPSYELKLAYDDNIYLAPPNENGTAVAGGGVRGSWILTNAAGLKLDLPIGYRHKLTAGYLGRDEAYKTQPSANNAFHQAADAAWDFTGAVTRARLFDSYLNTRDRQFNPNSQTVAGTLVAREARWQNTAGASGEYVLGEKFFAGGDARQTVHKYISGALGADLNRVEEAFGLKGGYQVLPKTRVYLSGVRQIVHYTAGRSANHKDWLGSAGVEGRLSPKITGMLEAGYQYREYDRDDPANIREPVARTWQASARLRYVPEENVEWNLRVSRALNEAASNSSGGPYYASSGVLFDALYRTVPQWVLGLNAGYQRDQYAEAITLGGLTTVRRDDIYSGGLKAEYEILDWLTAGASWQKAVRRSIFTRQFNYTDNLSTLALKASF